MRSSVSSAAPPERRYRSTEPCRRSTSRDGVLDRLGRCHGEVDAAPRSSSSGACSIQGADAAEPRFRPLVT